jgi:tetratricopeptide (TPR) repeat protein
MKKELVILSAVLFASCHAGTPLIGSSFADSLSGVYSAAPLLQSNDREIRFWKNRIDTAHPGEINEARYAGALVTRFRYTGVIADVFSAERIYKSIDSVYRHRISGPLVQLVATDLLTHRFSDADTLLEQAGKIGIERYSEYNVSFDVLFELGRWQEAAFHLRSLRYYRDYNYYFRKAKYEHLLGNTDSALAAIRQAVALANQPGLKALALSNEGDLLLHTGRFPEAAQNLKKALRLNPADLHTLLAIGWIALVHDEDTSLADRIFHFAAGHNELPDPWFKLYQMGQWRKDTARELYFARKFAARASASEYGGMYNKYLIELYCGILHHPEKAEDIAREELKNRATPQTFAWYAFALLCNHKQAQAYQVVEKNVSGKPLEAIELFYCGKVLKAAGKGYDANAYFDAALKNRADLSPAMIAEIARSGD